MEVVCIKLSNAKNAKTLCTVQEDDGTRSQWLCTKHKNGYSCEEAKKKLQLAKPPRKPGEKAWWAEDYTNARKIRDRELFA